MDLIGRPRTIRHRSTAFAYPADANLAWSGRVPEFACAANAVSLMMPHVEPYVAKSVRDAIGHLADPGLADQARDYVRQEASHQREHRRFNQRLASEVRGTRRLDALMARVYGRLAIRPKLGSHLAFAAGSETVAYAAARWAADHRHEVLADADPAMADLFLWHLAEEVEHKNVAFDVFFAVDGSRRRFIWGMVQSFMLLALFTVAGTMAMLAHRRRLWHPVAACRLVKWSITFLFELLPAMVLAALPGHHPSDLTDPAFLVQWLDEFSAPPPQAAEISADPRAGVTVSPH